MRLAIALFGVTTILVAANTADIKVDQVGYLPERPKIALVATGAKGDDFTIRRSADGAVVYKGKLSAKIEDPDTGDRVQSADFTTLKTTGSYYLDAPSVGRSWPFRISPDVYRWAFYLTARAFYGQRCGIVVDLGPEFPTYKHPPCHVGGAFHASSGKTGASDATGGWHDAGDYGRYVVNSGISTATLLWTWELFGKQLGAVNLQIPESGNGTPDILNEARWNLKWVLGMQDVDGGVWHKQTSERFCGFVMPEKDPLVSYVIGTGASPFKSSCATADFAAVMAISARIFRAYDPAFSRRCLDAALRAWSWLNTYPQVLFRNPVAVLTGEYGDRACSDERLWAAAELSRTTRDAHYTSYFLDHYREFLNSTGAPSWGNVAKLALWTYVLGGGPDASAVAAIRDQTVREADELVVRANGNPYRTTMQTKDYGWGSNGTAANAGFELLVANELHPNPSYVNTAIENLHYLLGRNTFSLSWVTQVGANPFRHPHHRPSGADTNAEPWPGLLSGGPNRSKQDPAMRKLPDLPPARMYLDEQESYATNEVAINWNAPLVLLLAGTMSK